MKLEEERLARLQCLEEAVAPRLPKVDLIKALVPRQELVPVLVSDSDEGTHVAILSGLGPEDARSQRTTRYVRHPALDYSRIHRQVECAFGDVLLEIQDLVLVRHGSAVPRSASKDCGVLTIARSSQAAAPPIVHPCARSEAYTERSRFT